MCLLHAYLSFLFVFCPVSCLVHRAFLFECTQSNRWLSNGGSLVCLASWQCLCRDLLATPNNVLKAKAVSFAGVLRFQPLHCDLLGFLGHFWPERYTIVVRKFELTLLKVLISVCTFLHAWVKKYTHKPHARYTWFTACESLIGTVFVT